MYDELLSTLLSLTLSTILLLRHRCNVIDLKAAYTFLVKPE